MSEPRKVFIDTFEYIKQLVQMGQEPVYSITDYRNVKVLESELQGRPGINHVPNYEDGSPVWLGIERLHKSKAPSSLNEKLEPWLNQSHQPAKEPSLKEWILVTLSGQEAEELIEKGFARKENVLESPREQGMFDVRLFAKDNTELNLAFTDYLQKQWLPWAYGEKPRRETIAIYEKFFTINQLMMAGEVEQPIELVWGIGHAVWKIPESNKVISHPLIETLVEVDLDSTSQVIRIRPRSVTQERPSLFTAPFEALELPGVKPLKEHFENQLDQMEAEEKTIHPADPTSFEGILRNVVSLLSDAFYVPDVVNDITNRTIPSAEESLAITDTWAIYARARGVNYLVRDLERFQEKAKSDDKINSSVAIKFAKEPSAEKPMGGKWDLSGRVTRLSSGALVGEISKDRDKENTLYFPKPFNDAQRDIIERLDKSDGVVVQGPPGTGKTHTIANIICHYLATGRRVLVTAKSETALDVLKEQIPKEIQPLIVSMVSNDREGMQQQKEAIETLQVKVVGLQGRERQIYREIELGEEEVFQLQQDIRIIDQQIKDFAIKQLEPLKLEWLEEDFENAGALAKWVVENRDYYKWFPDELGEGNEYAPLFGDDDIQRLIKAKQVVAQDIQYLNYSIPTLNDLHSTDIIERIHHELITAKNLESKTVDQGIPRFQDESVEAIQIAEGLVQEIRAIHSWVSENEAGWLNTVLQSRVYPERPLPGWLELIDELRTELNLIVGDRKKYLRKPVTFDANGAKERALLKAAVERGKVGKNPLTVIQRLNKQTQAVLQSVTILGKEPASKEDWEHIEEYLSFEDKCNELTVRWNAIAAEAPIAELVEENAAKFFEAICEKIEEVESIAHKLTKTAWWGLDKIFPKTSAFHNIEPKQGNLEAVVSAINQNLNMYRLSASKEMRREAIKRLADHNCPESKALYEILTKKIGSDDVSIEDIKEKWIEQITRLRYLHGLASSFETIRDVTEKIRASGAANWATIICQEALTEQEKERLQGWKEVWRWARLNSILHLRDIQHQLIVLEESRMEKEIRIKQIFEDVVKQRTYLMLCQSMTDKAKSGLAKFMAAIMNAGRGRTGIKAPIFMRAAQRAMLQCAEAIPCWIMPSWRVCEVLPAEFDFFDLVVVDEASQCDIRELPAIARGKKLLIVGDDRQVSPTAPFIEFKKFLQLKYNYLSEQPFGDLMLPGFSLYDLACAVFPGNKTILNEHFRCVEPIIRFSFQFYSGITIHPLRIPKATERIDPPLVDIFVENGLKNGDLNYEEANVIVNEIEKLISDSRYKGRSIGVISLIGRKQAALIQTRLLERIGHEKYLKHQIICGDSATFQGREKDIVFLSMVASPGRSRALTMRLNEQRFNVAASLARDRLYVVRSVELDELKQGDLKAQLIRHFQEPMPERRDVDKDLLDLCESDFERKVFIELTNRGYFITPQVPVGDYRIDLVIEGDNDRRLAVELDGDKHHGPEKWLEDWIRQKILERVGWKFWRCWASSYINDPEGCLNSLTQKLEDMGIKPQRNKAKRFAYTEHRRVNTMYDESESEIIEDLKADEVVGVGDKVVLSLEDHSEGFVTVLITEDHTDYENLIFAKDHHTAVALIDKEINDEVEVDICGKQQKVCVVQIAKDGNDAADPLDGTPDAAEILTGSKLGLLKEEHLVKTSNPKVDNKHPIQTEEQTSIQLEFPEQISQKQQESEPTGKYPDPLNASRDLITKYLNLIVNEHGPIIVEHAYHIYLERAGIKRLGRQIKRILNQTIAAMLRKGIILNADSQLKTKGMIDMVVKTPNQDDVVIREFFIRPIERIPKNELRALALRIKDDRPELDEEELMRAILEKYGLKRLTEKTQDILSEVIKVLNN
ncbi:MAG: AAA domain-containing protein [Eubacteriales bacterium]